MTPVAQKMEYVLEDSTTGIPTTLLWKDNRYPHAQTKTPEFIEDYIQDINTSETSSTIIDMLMQLRKSSNFRTLWGKLMVNAAKQYDDWSLPDYAIGIKLTIIFKFPQKWGIPDTVTWESSYNTYTEEIGIGVRNDPSLEYKQW